MQNIHLVTDRPTMDGATELIALFGEGAAIEAAARADRSREVGNVLHFCRWRQIERLILLLEEGGQAQTIH